MLPILSFVLLLLPTSYCGNILAIVPTPSYSHQVSFSPLWRELSLKGHNITVLTTDPQNDPKLTNLTEIDLKWTYQFVANISKMVEVEVTMWNNMEIFIDILRQISEGQLSYGPVQKLLRGEESVDVLFVEASFPEFLGFAEVYNCPTILMISVEAPAYFHRAVGNPVNPVLYPEILSSFFAPLNFKERLISTIYDVYLTVKSWRIFLNRSQIVLNKFFNATSTVEELIHNADMLFVNANPIFQPVRALGPSTINFGGYERNTSKVPLPKDVQKFLDDAKEGFIYFSLGSNVKSKDLRKETLDAIIDTLKSLPYKVLWKFEADELPGKPENVKLIKWSPQQTVLAHPNIKLFVTQGGLQSMEEAIFSEVPLVVIPFFGDQEQNAKLMKSKGIAITVQVRPYLDKDELKSAMLEVITNPKYKNAVIRLKQLALDTPMSGLEKAVWWTEYVIRNKGAKHLRNPAADIPFYQYYLLDVIGFLLAVTAVVIYVAVKLVLLLYRFIFSRVAVKPVTIKKKVN